MTPEESEDENAPFVIDTSTGPKKNKREKRVIQKEVKVVQKEV